MHEGTRAFPGCLRVISIGRQSFPRSNSGKRLQCDTSLNLQFILPALAPEFGRLALCSKASGGRPRDCRPTGRQQVSVGKKTVGRLPRAPV
jgi:hypothetical protein